MEAEPMRALSIQPPWSGAIAFGAKTVENRTWGAPEWITGKLIAIHASKKPDWYAPIRAWTAAGLHRPDPAETTQDRWCQDHATILGAVVGVARVTGSCVPWECQGECSPWAVQGQDHWQLTDVRLLTQPVPCRGALGLWRLPEDVEKLVRAQLEER